MDTTLLLITIPLAWLLIWCWPTIRVALRLPGTGPKIATDMSAGLAQIALPADWTQTNSLAANAALQAVDRFRGRYVIVISEPLENFDANIGLREYSDSIMRSRLYKQDPTKITGPVERTVASYPAVQYEYSARVRGMHITYLVTFVQGARAFHQVDCWSLSSMFNRGALEKVVDGFEERPGPIAERPSPRAEWDRSEPPSGYPFH
jgi:hypothetical protein